MDWPKVIRELRLLATKLPADRFYALYVLLAAYLFVLMVKR